MKRKYIVYNSVAFVLYNIVFWMINYYPRHIIDYSSNAFTSSIINLILFSVHIFMMFTFFGGNTTVFGDKLCEKGIEKRSIVLKCILLLFVQLSFELLRNFLDTSSNMGVSAISNLMILVVWIVSYFIITGDCKFKLPSSTIIAVFIAIIVITSALCVFVDGILLTDVQKYCAKYRENSNQLNIIRVNYDFLRSIVTLVFDSMIACALIFFHSFRIENSKVVKVTLLTKITVFTVRMEVMLLVAVVLMGVKVLIFPYSCFGGVDISQSVTTVHMKNDRFDKNTYETRVYRVAENRKSVLCYNAEKITIHQNNKPLVSFISFSTNVEDFVKYEVADTTVYVYGNSAICYIENDTPYTILFRDINKCPDNIIVTEICKKLIDDGNIVAFEYSAEYLKQHTPDFISAYIIRYSNGEFNSIESEMLDELEYRQDYISNIAKTLK